MLFLHPNGPGGVHADHHHHQEQGLVMSTMDCHPQLAFSVFWPSPLVHKTLSSTVTGSPSPALASLEAHLLLYSLSISPSLTTRICSRRSSSQPNNAWMGKGGREGGGTDPIISVAWPHTGRAAYSNIYLINCMSDTRCWTCWDDNYMVGNFCLHISFGKWALSNHPPPPTPSPHPVQQETAAGCGYALPPDKEAGGENEMLSD